MLNLSYSKKKKKQLLMCVILKIVFCFVSADIHFFLT